jgi:aspartate beta-hydroxylase
MYALYDRAGRAMRAIYDARIHTPPVLNRTADFPNGERFVASWGQLRDEALRLAAAHRLPRFEEIMAEQASISAADDRDWRIFILKAYGREFPENMARAPVLAALLREIPEVLSASYSYLAPHKHIPSHRGPFRGILRFHLGLTMPLGSDGRPATILAIDGCEHRFGDGECLLWDDTYSHEVWNRSDETRIALLLDVWRPEMPIDMELLSRLVVRIVNLGISWRGFTGSVSH